MISFTESIKSTYTRSIDSLRIELHIVIQKSFLYYIFLSYVEFNVLKLTQAFDFYIVDESEKCHYSMTQL